MSELFQVKGTTNVKKKFEKQHIYRVFDFEVLLVREFS